MWRRRLVTLTIAILCAVLPTAGHATRYEPPKSLVLQLGDMPPGFTETKATSYTAAQAEKLDHLAPGTLARHGWWADYETDFQRSALIGLLAVNDTVAAYHSGVGVRWSLQSARHQATTKLFNGSRFRPMSIGRIGDDAAGYEWHGKYKGYNMTAEIVLFRRGSYAAFVEGDSLANPAGPDEVILLAHVLDSRIRTSH